MTFWDALLKKHLYRDEAIQIYGWPLFALSIAEPQNAKWPQVVNSYPYTNVIR